MTGMPTTVSQLFPSKWLRAGDLPETGTRVKVATAELENIRRPDGEERLAIVLSFTAGGRPCQKRLACNKTQAMAASEVLGTEEFSRWPGHDLLLVPGRASNGKATVVVKAARDA